VRRLYKSFGVKGLSEGMELYNKRHISLVVQTILIWKSQVGTKDLRKTCNACDTLSGNKVSYLRIIKIFYLL
jgi:hypothetical protein